LKWKTDGNNTVITVPESVATKLSSKYVAVFRIKQD